MRAFIRFLLLLIVLAAMVACYPITDLQQTGTPPPATAVIAPALSALKQVSPQLPSPTETLSDSASSYPYPPPPSPNPNPYPAGGTDLEITPQLSEFDIFLQTRAAELHVPELEGEMLSEALQLLEGTRQAMVWQKLSVEVSPALSWDPILELKPGETHQFSVGFRTITFYDYFPLVDIQTSWSISPSVGATIDPQTGFFAVDENTPHGTVYTVTADVENGHFTPTINVYVYTLEENPLIGRWYEEKQITCTDEEEILPVEPMQELEFFADGTFAVDWARFEDLQPRDYWGTYSYDLATGELILNVEDSTYMPPDFDGSGFAEVDGDNRLMLEDFWLGKPQHERSGTHCGHIFIRG